MNKNFETEYRQFANNDVPDLWNRIEASIDKLESEKTEITAHAALSTNNGKNTSKTPKVIPFISKYSGLIATVACLAVIMSGILVLKNIGLSNSSSSSKNYATYSDDVAEVCNDYAAEEYSSMEENMMAENEMAATECMPEADQSADIAPASEEILTETEEMAPETEEMEAETMETEEDSAKNSVVINSVSVALIKLPSDKFVARIINDSSYTFSIDDVLSISEESPAWDDMMSMYDRFETEVECIVDIRIADDGSYLIEKIQ